LNQEKSPSNGVSMWKVFGLTIVKGLFDSRLISGCLRCCFQTLNLAFLWHSKWVCFLESNLVKFSSIQSHGGCWLLKNLFSRVECLYNIILGGGALSLVEYGVTCDIVLLKLGMAEVANKRFLRIGFSFGLSHTSKF
jgi:hypothetical protein